MAPLPERKIKVGVVIPFYHPVFGGAENQCRGLLREMFAAGGVEFSFLLTWRKEKSFAAQDRVDGVPVFRLGLPGLSRLSHYLFYLRIFFRLLRIGRQVDLIHCHATWMTGFAATLAGQLIGRPVLLKLSTNGELAPEPVPSAELKGKLARQVAYYLGRQAAIVALNREGMAELHRCGSRRGYLIPNGVDMERFHPVASAEREAAREGLGLTKSEIVFVFSGRFVQRKGIDLLTAAFAEVTADPVFSDVRLLLLGSGASQAESVAHLVNAVSSHAIRTIETDDVPRFLQAADVFVFPSRREGLPNAVLEALASGLPCILSDIGPHGELAETNPQAFIRFFPSGDAIALAEEMKQACHEIRERRQAQLPLQTTLSKEYQLDEVARRYLQLYRELVNA